MPPASIDIAPTAPGAPTRAPLRIAVASETPPGGGSPAAQALGRLTDALAARGCDVRFACPEPGPPPSDRAAAGVRLAGQHQALTAWWRGWRPDVVHLESLDGIGLAAWSAARDLGIRAAAPLGPGARAARDERGLTDLLAIHRQLDLSMVESADDQRWLLGHGVARVARCGAAVDARRFHPARRDAVLRDRWGAGDGDPVWLWAPRQAGDDAALVAEACAAARARAPRLRAVAVAEGPVPATLQGLLPWAVSSGGLGAAELAIALASADLVLCPAPADPVARWTGVVCEAMAAGVPALAFASAPGASWLADGRAGRAVADGDRAGFVAAARALADPDALGQGAAARALAEPRSWPACAAAIADAYAGLLSVGAAPGAAGTAPEAGGRAP